MRCHGQYRPSRHRTQHCLETYSSWLHLKSQAKDYQQVIKRITRKALSFGTTVGTSRGLLLGKVDRVTANHSLSSTAIQQKSQHSLSLLSLSWDVTARHKNEEKNRQAVDKFPNSSIWTFPSYFLSLFRKRTALVLHCKNIRITMFTARHRF